MLSIAMRRPDKIILSDEQLTVLLEGEREVSIPWDEVYAVSCYKDEGSAGPISYVTFDHVCGEYFETHDQMEGFEEMAAGLATFLPLEDPEWRHKLLAASTGDESVTIYQARI